MDETIQAASPIPPVVLKKKTHFTKKRLFWLVGIIVVVSAFFGYRAWSQPNTETKYLTSQAQKGMLIVSLSGSGQVSAQDQVDIKPGASGKVTALLVKEGAKVKKDDVLMEIDRKDALKSVRDAAQSVHDAEVSVASAKLSLQKIKQPPTAIALLQAQNSINQAERDLANLTKAPDAFDLMQAQNAVLSAEQNAKISSDGKTPQVIRNAYDSMVATLKSTSQTLGYELSDADNVLGIDGMPASVYLPDLYSVLDTGYKARGPLDYRTAKIAVTNATAKINALPLQGADVLLIDEATVAVQDALTKMQALMDDLAGGLGATMASANFSESSLDGLKSNIQSDRSGNASKQSGIITQQQAITSAKTSYTNSSISLTQAQNALEKLKQPADANELAAATERLTVAKQQMVDLKAGPSAIDLQVSENSLDSRMSALASARNKLADVQETLNDYSVRAPFDGVIATVSTRVADSASAGAAAMTMIADHMIAKITLNEVDVAKVAVGQKVTLTFDAIENLSITGQVEDIATLGTVSQGVVTYAVKIAFDTQDSRIRDGMSVSAAVITATKQDVVMVPNAAVKTSGGQSYVEIFDASSTKSNTDATGYVTGTPKRQIVEIGIANDTMTEIVSGLTEAETVVTQTIQGTSTTKTAASNGSSIRIPGLTTGGATGGAARAAGGATFTRPPGD